MTAEGFIWRSAATFVATTATLFAINLAFKTDLLVIAFAEALGGGIGATLSATIMGRLIFAIRKRGFWRFAVDRPDFWEWHFRWVAAWSVCGVLNELLRATRLYLRL